MLLPWAARSITLTGYLLYPVSTFDIFKFSWRIPEKTVEKQQAILTTLITAPWINETKIIQDERPKVQGEYPTEELPYYPKINIFHTSLRKWFGIQNSLDKGYFMIFLASIILTIILAIYRIRTDNILYKHLIAIWLVLLCATFFCMINAPAMRFLHGILWVCVSILILLLPPIKIIPQNVMRLISICLPLFIALFLLKAPVMQIISHELNITKYVLLPEPRYLKIETVSFFEDNFQAIRPKKGIRCWNEDIPCLPCERLRVKMRGATLRDGFVPANP